MKQMLKSLRSTARRLLDVGQSVPRRGSGIAENTIQIHGNTAEDRYPKIFSKATELVIQGAVSSRPLRVLSFGCSTGEEAYALATKYFRIDQDVMIIGLDINPTAIKVAKANNPAPERVQFFESNDYELAMHGPYDLVFAMSVLCVWPETASIEDISPFMTFDQFEAHLRNLDSNIRSGGYLVIYNSSFCFSDSAVAINYEPVSLDEQSESGFVKKFDSRNRSLGASFSYPHVIFQKIH